MLLASCLLIANAAASSAFFMASYGNYPGGVALRQLHKDILESWSGSTDTKPAHVHICVKAAMTGISRYGEVHGAPRNITYSKAEDLEPGSDFQEFSHLITDHPAWHAAGFTQVRSVSGFSGIARPREVLAGEWPFKSAPQLYLMRAKQAP